MTPTALSPGFLGWLWAAAHALYLGAVAFVLPKAALRDATVDRRPRLRPFPSPPTSWSRSRVTAVILAVGLVPRLLLLPGAPVLSEDLYRYLWDGRLVLHGVNPFAHAPSDPSLAIWRDALFTHLRHAEVPTVYPPVAQALFALASAAGETPAAWKTILFALESVLVAALVALLTRRRLPPERLLLYYWNPLVVVECYGSGHVDLAAAAFLVTALALWEPVKGAATRSRAAWAGLAFGAAALVKVVPMLLLPALVRRRAWTSLAAAAALAALFYLPFLGAGSALVEGLRIYARHWDFNGPVYTLLRPAFRSGDAPRWILAAALGIALLVIAWRARSLTGAALASWLAFLVLSPTVYPWYLVPAVALLPLHPDAGLLVFSGTVALTYLPLGLFRATGAWSVPSWILAIEYGSLAAIWLVAWGAGRLRVRQARRAPWAIESSPT